MTYRIKKEILDRLLFTVETPSEKGFVISIIKAQKKYPSLTKKKYNKFWEIYDKYFIRKETTND